MSKLFYKGMIEDMQNYKCTDVELEAFIGAFEYTVKQMVTTLARKSCYELQDYPKDKQNGIERFTLTLERRKVRGQEQWHGTFEYGRKKLKIIATLEKN